MKTQGKIGVLTFHRCINYGSYWQARCLVEGLRARGHEAVIVNHDSWRIRRAEWTCGLRPVLPTPVPKKDYLLYGMKMARFSRAISVLPRSRRFPLDKPGRMEHFRRVIVGSDEVWNLSHPWYGGSALFFGAGLRAERLIAHAASFGNYDAAWGLESTWANWLGRFAAISVRDENSRSLVKTALGLEPQLVLDPCLQFPLQPENRWQGTSRPFVAVYGHNFSEAFARSVRRWAEQRKLPLVSLGYRNAWADSQWITADPEDFAHAMRRTEAVATNFFHGCVFALRYARPFACESSLYRSTKIRDLMAAVGGEQHLVPPGTPDNAYEALLGSPLEPGISESIERLRRRSDAYLDQALA